MLVAELCDLYVSKVLDNLTNKLKTQKKYKWYVIGNTYVDYFVHNFHIEGNYWLLLCLFYKYRPMIIRTVYLTW